ncbi:MAG: threonine synthase [Candidatus Melainabacteria bacterium]|nr:MAG: threonine synthase [Candidatus Melainabacteria bacterium]
MPEKLTLIEKYREHLPVTDKTPIVSLGEGGTPLVPAEHLPALLGVPKMRLFFKLEGLNPTGSFKDRGMTLAISKATEAGSRAVICASTGNTSASAAAFAGKAGLKCYVILPAGKVALGKVAQAILYGAKIVQVNGNFDQALQLVREVAEEYAITIVNSINPYRLEGQKTAAIEIVEKLGRAPDFVFIPVGNAGNISAYWRGFKLCQDSGMCQHRPRMFGFEAEGAAAIVKGAPISNPETIATAIRIGNPASWQEAVKAAHESNGQIDSVSDKEILYAYQLVAHQEGIFCEPSSAAAIAGLIKKVKAGLIPEQAFVTCVLTGNGLKDPDTAIKVGEKEIATIEPTLTKLKEAIEL